MRTPWGDTQDEKKYSDEVISVMTAGHGGFHVTGQSQKIIIRKYPQVLGANAQKFCRKGPKAGWYEEDCEAILVIDCFPEFFKPETCAVAAEMIKAGALHYMWIK